jgi:hypothetical protein
MELAHPAGAEPLAPQPSQLASAVASTKKSLLANLRNLDGRAQPSPNAIPVARKIKKVLKTMRYRRRLLAGRIVGLSDRATMVQGEQPAASACERTIGQAPSIGGGMCPNDKHL